METQVINTFNKTGISTDSSWSKLLDLYNQIKALYEDLQKNPQNEMTDLGKMISLAQQMLTISDKLPTPPSAPNFHPDFQGLVNDLEQLQSSLLSGTTNNPNIEEDVNNIGGALENIFSDIMQG